MTAKKKHPRSSRVPGWQGVSVVTQVWRNQKGPVIRNRADHDAIIPACGRLCLHRKRTNISTVLAGQKARHQGGRRGHLARQLHALRSRLLRPGAESLATPRQPVPHEVVTHVLGTFCYLCLRAGQRYLWRWVQSAANRSPCYLPNIRVIFEKNSEPAAKSVKK